MLIIFRTSHYHFFDFFRPGFGLLRGPPIHSIKSFSYSHLNGRFSCLKALELRLTKRGSPEYELSPANIGDAAWTRPQVPAAGMQDWKQLTHTTRQCSIPVQWHVWRPRRTENHDLVRISHPLRFAKQRGCGIRVFCLLLQASWDVWRPGSSWPKAGKC